MCYLPARAYRPTDHVLSQLNVVHKIALGLNNWHLTMPILQLPAKEGGLAQANLAAYAEWVHSQSFVRFVQRPAQFAERHVAPFRRWAFSVGLLIEEEFLPFLQVALVPLPQPSFLQGSLKSYSVVRREGGDVPPPPIQRLQHMPVWHNALLRNFCSFSYWSPPLIRRGVMRWGDLVDNGAIPLLLWDMLAPTWRPVYLERVGQIVSSYKADLEYKGPELGSWAASWSSRRMLLFMQHRRRHPARQTLEVWRAF